MTGVHAISWRTADGGRASGSLTLDGDELVVRGTTAAGEDVGERFALDRVTGVRIGRSRAERIDGQRSVVLDLDAGRSFSLVPLAGGVVLELAELLTELAASAAATTSRVAVVLPLRAGSADRARELVADGPPFDLGPSALDSHSVFVTEREVVFLFEGPEARAAIERLVHEPRVLRGAAKWRGCLGGRSRVAEEVFAWTRSPNGNGRSRR